MQTLACAGTAKIELLGEEHVVNEKKSGKPQAEPQSNPAPAERALARFDPPPDPKTARESFTWEKKTKIADPHSFVLNGTKTRAKTGPSALNGMPARRHGDQQVHIRPYRTSDRDAFCRLCCDTGFLGGPVDSLFQDRELFADLFTRPYLDHEPEWVLVAEVDGEVAGYLLGSVCKHFNAVLAWSGLRTTLKMLLRLATGRYGCHPRSRRFIRWLLTAGFREQPKHPRDAAHLHIQIDKEYRGRGIGRQLWEHYEKELRAIGMTQCYGAFFSHPQRRPEMAYRRYGFTVFDRRRTTMFQPEIREPVEVVCVCKKL